MPWKPRHIDLRTRNPVKENEDSLVGYSKEEHKIQIDHNEETKQAVRVQKCTLTSYLRPPLAVGEDVSSHHCGQKTYVKTKDME